MRCKATQRHGDMPEPQALHHLHREKLRLETAVLVTSSLEEEDCLARAYIVYDLSTLLGMHTSFGMRKGQCAASSNVSMGQTSDRATRNARRIAASSHVLKVVKHRNRFGLL